MRSPAKTFVSVLFLIFSAIVISSCKKDGLTPPVITTANPSEITQTAATSGGNIISDGGAEITVAGVCYSTLPNPSVKDKHTNDSKVLGSFSSNLTGLTPNTNYYIRAYAHNVAGTAYGNEVSFTTSQIAVATLTTADATLITSNSAVSGGDITFDGGDPVSARGVCWDVNPNPTVACNKTTDGSGQGTFNSSITNLQPLTTYYVRAYATNSVGTAYGNEITFITVASAPIVFTLDISFITTFTAKSGGTVLSDGGGGPVTARGVCWSVMQNPTTDDSKTDDGLGLGTFTSNIINLKANSTYFVRGYATNLLGTNYGNQLNFTTTSDTIIFNKDITYSTVRDIDGNTYKTVQIGSQTWMAENLKTTHYADGVPINYITDNFAWEGDITGAYCYYENEFSNKYLYGALYNWYAVNNGHLCPDGWHVPTNPEWTLLTDFLGGEPGTGGKLKETGITHWESPNTGASNETGFTALPGGWRFSNSEFHNIKSDGIWWTATFSSSNYAYYRYLFCSDNNLRTYDASQKNGYSVRCVKD